MNHAHRQAVMPASNVLFYSFLPAVALAVFSLAAATPVSAVNGADPNHGKELFEKRCGGCHSLNAEKEGPRLGNVYGRKSGTISSFKYSEAVKSSAVLWDANSLDKWLTNTESVIPDNDMDFRVPKPDERADIIEYLRVTAGK
jgi:cytochrome c